MNETETKVPVIARILGPWLSNDTPGGGYTGGGPVMEPVTFSARTEIILI